MHRRLPRPAPRLYGEGSREAQNAWWAGTKRWTPCRSVRWERRRSGGHCAAGRARRSAAPHRRAPVPLAGRGRGRLAVLPARPRRGAPARSESTGRRAPPVFSSFTQFTGLLSALKLVTVSYFALRLRFIRVKPGVMCL